MDTEKEKLNIGFVENEPFDGIETGDEEESLGLYAVKLKDFEGPFDILCHLIRKSKYSLEDVKISEITEQYMQYMEQIDELDLEKATEFVTMAAWLLEIKSKSLLPVPAAPPEEDDDPEKRLKQQLAQYSLFKEAGVKMREIETVDILYRAPDESVGRPRFLLKDMDTEGLLSALSRVFLKLEQRAEEIRDRHIIKDSFTVEDKIAYIKDRLLTAEFVSFFDLFGRDFNRSEVITTFLALLELLKAQFLVAEQSVIYGDIVLKRAESGEEGDEVVASGQ